jgi:hypothetical protein
MPDLDQDLPTGNELSWKAMFASTETVRAMVYRLLDAGLCRDDDEHPLVTDHRLDSTGYGIDDSPSGRIIRDLVASGLHRPKRNTSFLFHQGSPRKI